MHIRNSFFFHVLLFSFLISFLAGCDEGLPTSSFDDSSPSNVMSTNQATESSSAAQGNSSEVIPGQYIIQFKEDVRNVQELAEGLAQQVDGEVLTTWTFALTGFGIGEIDSSAAQKLGKNATVKSVNPNIKMHLFVRQSVGSSEGDSWGLDRVNQRSGFDGLYTAGATGSGVTAYVIDSGVRVSHYDFGSRASSGYDFVDNDGTANDCNGHGTHVAGILGGTTYGIAKGVDIVAVRIADCAGGTDAMTITDGIEWVGNNHSGGPAVINLSVGGPVNSDMDTAVQEAVSAGFSVIAAAGQENQDACNVSPARVPEAITVSATNVNDERAFIPGDDYSNYGSCVDLFAPGREILSAWIGSDSDSEVLSGTSMAAPLVAGTAALRLENYSGETPQQVRDAIVQHATKNVVSNAQSANDHLLYSLLNHPKRPTSLTVSCTAWDSPHLEWTASTSSDVDHYEVLKGTGPDLWTMSVHATTSSTSYDDTYEYCSDGTNTDDEKYYRVRTVDTESLLSGESNFDSALITNESPYLQRTPTAPDSLPSMPTYEQPSPSDEVVRREPSIRRR